MDLTGTVIPKSDQLNADDLIPGPRTIRITRVSRNDSGGGEQPVNVFFEGDGGKPWRPCKGMRRVMIAVWGSDASAYAGRSMTLFHDPTVTWGGMEVGGIRISHMSHMDERRTLAVTISKKARKPYEVLPLREAPAATAPDKATAGAAALAKRITEAPDLAALEAITGDADVIRQRAWLAKNRPPLAEQVTQAVSDRLAALLPDDAPEPGSHEPDAEWPGPRGEGGGQ